MSAEPALVGFGGAGAAISTAEAYRRCEAITRTEAANFYYGIRLLSGERRRAMSAAYAFARRIDDIGDGTLARASKLELLDASAAQLEAIERSGSAAVAPSDPVIVALADAHARFSLPAGALGELIDGVRMDVEGVSYESFDELVLYCRRVAGAIGRVCLAIFATRERAVNGAGALDRAQIEALADDLGVALQLTNILRDVREDASNGRVYLPGEDLLRFGVGAGAEMAQSAQALLEAARREDEALVALMRFEAARAQQWFNRGMQLLPLLDRRSAACVAAMAGIYHRLLGRIEADPTSALRARMSLSGREKALVAVRSLAGRTT
ncbi:MAG TPA: squalene/phytoene synthase family protein [Solirubrobacteraceae bacterium]|nr:squalene/phytoene synthase family protein [Solirubrobacteraceae bacterium]